MKYTVNALLKIRCSGTESAISRVSENNTIAYFWSVGLIYDIHHGKILHLLTQHSFSSEILNPFFSEIFEGEKDYRIEIMNVSY